MHILNIANGRHMTLKFLLQFNYKMPPYSAQRKLLRQFTEPSLKMQILRTTKRKTFSNAQHYKMLNEFLAPDTRNIPKCKSEIAKCKVVKKSTKCKFIALATLTFLQIRKLGRSLNLSKIKKTKRCLTNH